ncbi:LysR family transcriptional regulator [Xanthomonas prunicola]|uniref:LysR family transcriptional regulator n=1 Tax=Xanthomonas prunicola TaxID=2053930 RepID=UPI0021B33DC5|nr:LysR family transcriptional regulator [Xanthomonas prunicola]UXA53437.1 LysR family transcriptional regulator [Xanthomonas prunicola]
MGGSDFAELKAFVAVVERQSFARAAEHLGLSPSALSQTIRQLEGRIGARLLNRTTRSVAPSASGELLYNRIAPLFREMAAAVAEAGEATGQMRGTLRINTLGIAARTIIAPRLARFHQHTPTSCSTSWSTTRRPTSSLAVLMRASASAASLRKTWLRSA